MLILLRELLSEEGQQGGSQALLVADRGLLSLWAPTPNGKYILLRK